MRRGLIGAAAAAGAVLLMVGSEAVAGGFEYPENGSIAMGRGGASVARASDPTALMLNTAGIVALDGLQVTVSGNVPFLSNCFTRAGTYQGPNQSLYVDGGDTPFQTSAFDPDAAYASSGTVPYPTVCNKSPLFVAPQILATYRFNRYFAIGLGVYGPNSIGNQSFDTTSMSMGMNVPSPNRYMLISENLLIVYPTLAVAVAPFPWLRIGAAIQPSLAQFQFSTMANYTSSQSPSEDLETSVSASGFFWAANFGLQIVLPRYFTIGAHMHYNQDTVNLTGTGTVTSEFYHTQSGAMNPPAMSNFTVDDLQIHLPISVKWGARLAIPSRHALFAQDSPHYDPMRDDMFDVEIDWMYERSSVFTNLTLMNSGSINVGSVMNPTNVPAPATIAIPHDYNDVWGVRLGSDINIVPDRFAVRLGASYELGAQSLRYAQLDLPSYTSWGVHAGLSVRFWKLTVSMAYAHFFMDPIDVVPNPGGNVSTIGTAGAVPASQCAMPTTGADVCGVNVGHYQASLDVLNLGITLHI